jgi:hypothetical protein
LEIIPKVKYNIATGAWVVTKCQHYTMSSCAYAEKPINCHFRVADDLRIELGQ